MRRMLAPAAVVLIAVAACALPGASVAGSYLPPPGDTRPVWSPDGSRIAYMTSRGGHALVEMSVPGGAERRVVEDVSFYGVEISPNWEWVAFVRNVVPDGQSLWISRLDGSGERLLATAGLGIEPVWSPDSRGLLFRQADGSLAVVGIDGGISTVVLSGGYEAAFSPDGTRIAYASGAEDRTDLFVLDFADGRPRQLVGGPGGQIEPKWSPDGTRIAFLTRPDERRAFRLGVVRADGSGLVTYPAPSISYTRSFAWMPTSDAIVFERNISRSISRLDLASGKTTQLTPFGSTPVPSPDGRSIAFAGTGECRDRNGIYVVGSDGTGRRRVTNDCRVLGTPADDVLRGTGLADVLLGLEGNDRITGLSGGYIGDTLLGGAGDDVLAGTGTGDLLRGGRGADRLFGGMSRDVLYGDSGPDRIDAQAGRDFVHARDGERDLVLCGTNHGTTPERDEAWVDDVDVVRGCEILHVRAG